MELQVLAQIQQLIDPVEQKLEVLAQVDNRVARLRTIPGVGPRLAEVVVAMARKLLVICWAMLRDGTDWREPSPALCA